MDDGTFSFDPDRLETIVAALGNLSGFLADQLEILDRNAADVASSWTGQAAAAYAVAHAEWMQGAKDFHDGLRDMQTAARTALDAYVQTHDVNTRMTAT